MPLKITKAEEPIKVDRLTCVIYAQPGIGKTSLAFTSAKPLLLDFDKGSYRAANRGDTVQIDKWTDVTSMTAEDLAPYSTIIMDTAGRALDVLTEHLMANPKNTTKDRSKLSIQGYGALKTDFVAFCKRLNGLGKDVVMIAHMDEQKSGDDVVERLDVTGGSKAEIYKTADMMGRLIMLNGRRELRFSPSDTAFGKNPGQLDPIVVPDMSDPAYASIIEDAFTATKDRLNQLSSAQKAALEEQEWFRETLPSIETAEALNHLLGRASDAGRTVKAMVNDRAKDLGLTFNKDAGEYVGSPEPQGDDLITEDAA